MLTFENIFDQVQTFLDEADVTGHSLDLVKFAVQTAHEKRLTEERWSFMLWPTDVSLSFLTDKKIYQLNSEVQLLSEFRNDTENATMREVPTRARYKVGNFNDRFHFEFVQNSPVKVQPAEGVLTVVGTALIKFIDENGDVQEETVTDTTSSATATEIITITKLNDAILTVKDLNNVTLLSLSATQYGKQYPQIRLFGNGVTGETGKYRFYRKPSALTLDNAIPDIPFPFSRILVYDALIELAAYNDSVPNQAWIEQQAKWDLQLRQSYVEGETEGSEARTINITDNYEG
jgi:hypothetical protein